MITIMQLCIRVQALDIPRYTDSAPIGDRPVIYDQIPIRYAIESDHIEN